MQMHCVDSVEAAARAARRVNMLQDLGANTSGCCTVTKTRSLYRPQLQKNTREGASYTGGRRLLNTAK